MADDEDPFIQDSQEERELRTQVCQQAAEVLHTEPYQIYICICVLLTACIVCIKYYFVCLQIEDLKFKLSTTEEQLLESNKQLQSAVAELQLSKEHCVQLEENRNDLTKQLERSRSDLIEVHTYIYIHKNCLPC